MKDKITMAGYIFALVLFALFSSAQAYPIDGYPNTGIARLEYYRLAQLGEIEGRQIPPGAWLTLDQVVPGAIGLPDSFEFQSDQELNRALRSMLGADARLYSIALLDISDPENPIYAELNGDVRQNVGSVGKLLVGLALFQKLHDLYPDNVEAREAVLRDALVVADEYIQTDGHEVVFFDLDNSNMKFRRITEGDTASLWEYLDWMYSASSNAAAAMVMKQLILMSHFGTEYPVDPEVAEAWFAEAGATLRGELLEQAMTSALIDNGLDPELLRQGSFFTRYGKNHVVGTTSYGNTRELLKLLYKVETGTLIDQWSSREIKRLMYMTERRIRYASHPALKDSAVYFKSGSLYSCVPEEGFQCGKYMGNRVNFLASVAIIEDPAENPSYRYMVVVTSNVLRVNSAVAHQTLAMRIHRAIQARHQARLERLSDEDEPQ